MAEHILRPYPASAARSARVAFAALVAGVLLAPPQSANADTPFLKCQVARFTAAAKYEACHGKALAKRWISDLAIYNVAAQKCASKYRATWAKLQAKFAGTGSGTCEGPRFVDNGDGTVTDRLTALHWEKKTDDDTVHDKDTEYRWRAELVPGYEGDGPLFTTFFEELNSGGCFAGTCDWRLPTLSELQTILDGTASTCAASPCIDPIFGPTIPDFYWTGTDFGDPSPTFAWAVFFHQATTIGVPAKTTEHVVRAVRGGF